MPIYASSAFCQEKSIRAQKKYRITNASRVRHGHPVRNVMFSGIGQGVQYQREGYHVPIPVHQMGKISPLHSESFSLYFFIS